MPSHFTLRMQFGPHQDPEEISEQLLRLTRETPMDEIMFFFFAEEQNDAHDTLERVRQWIERSRPYREALQKAGIKISLNPWHSVLHCDRGRKLKKNQDWQRMTDPTGREANAVVCFLDPDWRKYYFETLELYANEGFRVVWIDDDIRYHNHKPLDWGGCFCPLHVAEFRKKTGENAEREAIVRACLQPGAPHPWRNAWMDMWQETILAFLSKCGEILENNGTRMGLMSSGSAAHAAEGRRWEEWWGVFGRNKPPVHRPHFWPYSDIMGASLIQGISELDRNRTVQPRHLESGPEIENFPYGQWNKSFRQTFAQMALAHVLGSDSLNISLYDFMGNRPDDEPGRVAFLKRTRPHMDWLADNFPMSMESKGVGVPWSEDMGRMTRTSEGKHWNELICPCQGWAHWLGSAGIAFSARPQKYINALSGTMAWCFDGDKLMEWLGAGLLLDGPAAAVMQERGLGRFIGIESARLVTQDEILYSMEECSDPKFAARVGAQISVNAKSHTGKMLQAELMEGSRAISDLRGPLQDKAGHGAFIFQNELGGRTAVVPWDASANRTPVMMDIHRSVQLKRIVEWLGNGCDPGWVDGGAWLVPQFLTDGSAWRGVIWNAGPDEIEEFNIRRPHGMPSAQSAWHLTHAGNRLEAAVKGDTFRLNQPLHQWEPVVILNPDFAGSNQ